MRLVLLATVPDAMALTTKLIMRQGQALVMTPQLLQAIKLLQFSNTELAAFVEAELERNPLLERAEDMLPPGEAALSREPDPAGEADRAGSADLNDGGEADWSSDRLATDQTALEASLGTELGNSFEPDPAGATAAGGDVAGDGLSAQSWSGTPGSAGGDDLPDRASTLSVSLSLKDHLAAQLPLAVGDARGRLIGLAIIDAIDEAGYLCEPIEAVAGRLNAPVALAEAVLHAIQGFEPTGVGARSLAECLRLQLRERDRLDPAMATLLDNLTLVARRDFAALRRLCGVDDADVADMVAEIRRLDPKPGHAFGADPVAPVVPDVLMRAAPDGAWTIELNSEVLPRVLVNQTYAARVVRGSEDGAFVAGCLQTANWLTKSLEQRARTILKVASEIVRQQDAFFAYGIEHLRPLTLKAIADATGMHESTVSRVTSNKYMASPRGVFELRYFFTAAIASGTGEASHSAESVRFRIRQMVDQEERGAVLSDDAIVARLRAANVDIARRTVAKYRESLRIPSSVERRRLKAPAA